MHASHRSASRSSLAGALALLVGASPAAPDGAAGPVLDARTAILEAAAPREGELPVLIDRGDGRLPLIVPRGEELVYRVDVAWGILGAALGTVTMSSGVEPYRRALLVQPSAGEGEEQRAETAWIKARAFGKHLLYTMDATLEARHQPQEWPRIVYRSTQEGSEQRRRELLLGVREGAPTSSYRRDTSKGAPRGTRIWKDPQYREIPPDTLDMTSAVYLVRSFILRGEPETSFPVLEKERVWEIRLSLGQSLVQETPAGRFDAVEVVLDARPHPGETLDEDEKFEGLFGLRGSIHLWVERHTGIPVRVQGEIPAGPIVLDVDISLSEHRGTPRAFQAVPVTAGARR